MSNYLQFAADLAQEAGKVILKSSKESKEKSQFDIQAQADVNAESFIIKSIRENFPTHSILAEESGAQNAESSFKWVIDPLDGTINYAKGLDEYAVSIALVENGEPIIGVIFAPEQNKLYTAEKGGGAFLNSQKITVSNPDDLLHTVGGLDMTSNVSKRFELFDIAKKLASEVRHLRIFGSSALHLAKVSEGKLDFYFKNKCNYWDVCAGILLVREAGGVVTDFSGEVLNEESKNIVACSKAIHEPLKKALS